MSIFLHFREMSGFTETGTGTGLGREALELFLDALPLPHL